jgi:choline dehydrogenase-like flavoprotein
MDASIKPGVYLCDSSVFPNSPAASPTFTIMANARRITHLSLTATGPDVS